MRKFNNVAIIAIVGLLSWGLVGCGNASSSSNEPADTTSAEASVVDEVAGITMEEHTAAAMLNVVTNNPTLGDERDFVRIAEVGPDGAIAGDEYSSGTCSLRQGKTYIVLIGCHNAADPDSGEAGIAKELLLSVSFLSQFAAGEQSDLAAVFGYEADGVPQTRGAQVRLAAEDDLTLELSPVSASGYPMITDVNFQRYHVPTENIAVASTGDMKTCMIFFDDLAPGYENMRYIFLCLTAR